MDSEETLVIIDDTERSADLYYATRFLVSSKVVYVESAGRKALIVSDLEYGRARAEAAVDDVVPSRPFEEALRSEGRGATLAAVLDLYLRPLGIRELVVPAATALGIAEQLRVLGYALRVREEPFFPARAVKTEEEVRAIEEVQGHAEAAMGLVADMLARSEIRDDLLYLEGSVLTSERVQREIRKFLSGRDCSAAHTIVAGGDQAADPHALGSGPLPAHRTIVVDILPRSERTRYWGDMTRTFVRGRASSEVRRLHAAVLEAQELALGLVRNGAEAQAIHDAVARSFARAGHANGEASGKKTGFIHATGHGVGLEPHEPPRIGRTRAELEAGQVVAIEPGLYYPGVGSVRIEDTVVVTRDGHRNLNRFPKRLEL